MDNELADALASRLLKAFFDGPGGEAAQRELPPAKTKRADHPPGESGPKPSVPPTS